MDKDNKAIVAYDILVYNNGKITADSIIHEAKLGTCLVKQDTINEIEKKKADAVVQKQQHSQIKTLQSKKSTWNMGGDESIC